MIFLQTIKYTKIFVCEKSNCHNTIIEYYSVAILLGDKESSVVISRVDYEMKL